MKSDEEMKYQIIDEGDVPPKRVHTKWEPIFASIPRGKAIVFENVPQATLSAALFRFRRKGKFVNYYVTSHKPKVYVVNPKAE